MIVNLIGGPCTGASLTGLCSGVVIAGFQWRSRYVRTDKTVGDIVFFEFEELGGTDDATG